MNGNKGILWLWLSLVCGPASKAGETLLDAFGGSVEEIYNADRERYETVVGLQKKTINALCDKSLNHANEIIAFCKNEGFGILTPESSLYPARLARIIDRPLALYYKGVLKDLEPELLIASVGTRKLTEYGSHASYSIAYDLAKAGAVVVSGMAKGVDGMAHRGALDAGGYTVAVLGNGIDRAYPSEHLQLMNEIAKSGLVITEFKPFTPPFAGNFPTRNRIISGLCQGTVVVEAPAGSGALITAKVATEQGRDVFAVPGKVGELNSFGTNQLIKNGAKMVTSATDILLEYQPLYGNKINMNNIPSVKSASLRSPISLKVAAPAPDFSGRTQTEKAANEAVKRSEKKIISDISKKEKAVYSDIDGNNEADYVKRETKRDFSSFSDSQRKILELIESKKRVSSDDIVRETGIPIGDVLAELTMLEISGDVTALPGGAYCLSDGN